MPYSRVNKQPGDLARAQEWNDVTNEIVRLGMVKVDAMRFEPGASYWTGTTNSNVAGFSLSINTPTSGTLVAFMNALVQMSQAGKAIYLGPMINGQINAGNRGGYRAQVDAPASLNFPWFGTAAFNSRPVAAGTQTVQVHANIDGGTARIAWGSLVVMFFPDP